MKYEWPLREAIPHKCVFFNIVSVTRRFRSDVGYWLDSWLMPNEDFTDVTLVIDYAYWFTWGVGADNGGGYGGGQFGYLLEIWLMWLWWVRILMTRMIMMKSYLAIESYLAIKKLSSHKSYLAIKVILVQWGKYNHNFWYPLKILTFSFLAPPWVAPTPYMCIV